MTKQHARLASAVADAILAQGFTQKQVATAAGITQSALSSAIAGRYDIKEENWKMICENLGLCYEDVIADPEPETVRDESAKEKEKIPETMGGGNRSSYSRGEKTCGDACFQRRREKAA